MKSTTVNVRFDAELLAMLDAWRKLQDGEITRSVAIRLALRKFLNENRGLRRPRPFVNEEAAF